jgi:type IV pilus assembly protein PilY1
VLTAIVERVETSATSAATSAAVLQADTLLYSASFRSEDWSGNVVALEIDEVDGSVGATIWDAESVLAAGPPRNLLTHNGSSGVNLDYGLLSSDQQDALDVAADGTVDGLGERRIDWLSGVEDPALRSRSESGDLRLVGDIINGTPQFVTNRSAGFQLLRSDFSPGLYPGYVASKASRPELLLVPSNGGMLHGFDAEDGRELFAYVPGELLEPIPGETHSPVSELTSSTYEHRYAVDGTPTVSDVLIGGAWKTVMVGSMGVGGRSVFAVDISNPEAMTSGNVLWEFSDPDLGFGVTDVQIVPLENNVFGAVFGNGYNSDSHRAYLYVVNIADGSLIAKIDTGVGAAGTPNGLGPALVSDWPDGDFIAHYVYAGDLLGNLWRFDLSSAAVADWTTSALSMFNAVDPSGDPQPITVQPRVATNPKRPGELMVLFGTGSFFRVDDKDSADPQVQTLYGIRDSGATVVASLGDRGNLLQQEILFEDTVVALGSPRIVRETSNNEYPPGGTEKGWYLDLVSPGGVAQGERVISRATFPSSSRRERVRFSTLQFDADPCSAGRQGFIFDLDLTDGSEYDRSVFDINSDGFFNTGDLVGDRRISAIGGGFGEELTIIRDREGASDFFYDGGGNRIGGGTSGEGLATGDPVGRQSWQQLR